MFVSSLQPVTDEPLLCFSLWFSAPIAELGCQEGQVIGKRKFQLPVVPGTVVLVICSDLWRFRTLCSHDYYFCSSASVSVHGRPFWWSMLFNVLSRFVLFHEKWKLTAELSVIGRYAPRHPVAPTPSYSLLDQYKIEELLLTPIALSWLLFWTITSLTKTLCDLLAFQTSHFGEIMNCDSFSLLKLQL